MSLLNPSGDSYQSQIDTLVRQAQGGADTSWVKPTVGKLQQIEQQKEAEQEPERAEIKKQSAADKAEVERKYAGIEPVDLPKWDAQKEAAKASTNPIEAFGSFGSVFAILASAFTHTPITNALNGSAAAMQAIKKRDEEGYNRAYEAFQTNTKIALDRHNLQHQDYEDAFDKMKSDFAEGQAMLTMTAAKYGDQAATLMNEAGLYEKLGSLQESRANAARGLLEALPGLQMQNLKAQSTFALYNAQNDLDGAMRSGDPAKIIEAQTNLARTQQQINNVHAAENPYGAAGQQNKNLMADLELKAFNEKVDNYTAQNGRKPTANEQLTMMNEVKASEKVGSSFDAQVLADFRRDYAAMNGGKPPSAAEEAAYKASMKNVEPTLSDKAVGEMVDRFLAGDASVTQNMGRGNQGAANLVKFQNVLAEKMDQQGISGADQAFAMAQFKALTATLRTVGTAEGRILLGRTELQALIPVALQASKDLPRSSYPTANAVIQAAQTGTGDPRVRKLALSLQALKSAYSQVLVRGGATTDSARAAADELFSTRDPESVIETAFQQVQVEADAVAATPKSVMGFLKGMFGGKEAPPPAAPAGGTGPDGKDFSHIWGGQ